MAVIDINKSAGGLGKKQPKHIRRALTLATCSLLPSVSSTVKAEVTDSQWAVDAAYLDYSEEGRVKIAEPVIRASKTVSDDEQFEVMLIVDAMSGATPNGATPTSDAQTFSGPSGGAGYTTDPNVTPTREFTDLRVALNLSWDKALSSLKRNIYGGGISIEGDYASLGYNSTYSWDLPGRQTTFTAGGSAALDFILPKGGKPEALKNINTVQPASNNFVILEDDEGEDEGDEEFPELKFTADFLLGITQVVNRRILTQLNYSHAFVNGYLTDPYKVVSVVYSAEDAATVPGAAAGDSVPTDPGDLTIGNQYLAEKRPDSRGTNALYWKSIIHLRQDVVRFTYRYFWDDWGIKSHTADVKYRFELGKGFYFQPHYRYYQQTAADFYRHSIFLSDIPGLDYASADYRLGEFASNTIGIKLGKSFQKGGSVTFRVEKMTQWGNSHPDDAIGTQQNFDLFPTIKATIVQLFFSKNF